MQVREASYRPARPVDVIRTLAPLRRGTGDPCHRVTLDGTVWRTFRAPTGPVTLALRGCPDGSVAAAAWGPGAEWALDAMPALLGATDDDAGFLSRHPLLADSARRHPGLRIPRCGRVLEVLVPAVLEQKVTGAEARTSWRWLLRRYGHPAPGPTPAAMRVVPPAAVWARIPSWDWHRAGVDGKRAAAVRAAATVASRLEETLTLPAEEGTRRLRAVPGIGAWTIAEVRQRAHGDRDAVSVGDYHLPALVGWALAGRPLDDAGMLEVLAPYRPQRYRAIRLLECSGFRTPRFGPRLAPRDLRAC